MPNPLILGAAVSAGSNFLGSAINSISQIHQNKRAEKFSREMYNLQDQTNLRNWNMQNEYNSPQAQMQRFQDAGLNPNLIYGQGNSGPAGNVGTPDIQPLQYRSPEWGNAVKMDGLAYVNAMYDIDIKQAQIDNLKAQNTVYAQEALLKASQTERGRFDLGLDTELREVSADARREALRQLKTNIDLSINKDAREAAANSTSITEAIERMAEIRERTKGYSYTRSNQNADTMRKYAEIQNLKKDGTLKQLEIDLRKEGINPNDPLWTRVIARMLTKYFDLDGEPKTNKTWYDRLFGN